MYKRQLDRDEPTSALSGRWVEAADLKPGDKILGPSGAMVIQGVNAYVSDEEVFNLEVDDCHNFVVEPGVLVHNS